MKRSPRLARRGRGPSGHGDAQAHRAAALRVSLAGTLHNARAIRFELQVVGDELWTRFSAGPGDVLRDDGALADAFTAQDAGPIAPELRRTVHATARLAT